MAAKRENRLLFLAQEPEAINDKEDFYERKRNDFRSDENCRRTAERG